MVTLTCTNAHTNSPCIHPHTHTHAHIHIPNKPSLKEANVPCKAHLLSQKFVFLGWEFGEAMPTWPCNPEYVVHVTKENCSCGTVICSACFNSMLVFWYHAFPVEHHIWQLHVTCPAFTKSESQWVKCNNHIARVYDYSVIEMFIAPGMQSNNINQQFSC